MAWTLGCLLFPWMLIVKEVIACHPLLDPTKWDLMLRDKKKVAATFRKLLIYQLVHYQAVYVGFIG